MHFYEVHVAKSELKSENTDKPKIRGGQRHFSDNPVGDRILRALGDRSRKWLAEKSENSDSSISDYIAKGIAKADAAVRIAKALGVSVDWLLTGNGPQKSGLSVIDAENADWVMVPEYDLRHIDDHGKGEPIDPTPFRRDWLHAMLGVSSGLWLSRLLSDFPSAGLSRGSLVFCQDIRAEELLEGNVCIFRVYGGLVIGRFTFRPPQPGAIGHLAAAQGSLGAIYPSDMDVHKEAIGNSDGEYIPVARVLGAFMRPI
ncbi:helix-turn-helix domain-containing protein [Sphingomonas cavernae]|uniref:Helix-turn-helix domain-containing protein n=2 Tax=Sphingomonas cavernae TaxID=2320861 RepID=A0A418WMC5_9SPHN|nr:helix-turn-helix domain-containing protein [Sphingomonas cavernae]